MATSQPITRGEIELVLEFLENTGSNEIPLIEESLSLFERCSNVKNCTWYVYLHDCANVGEWHQIADYLKRDHVQNYVIFQKRKKVIIIHSCKKINSIKCRCELYSTLLPPRDRKIRINKNMLKSVNSLELFGQIFQACLEAEVLGGQHVCEIKFVKIDGQKFTPQQLRNSIDHFKIDSDIILNLNCGLKIREQIQPCLTINISDLASKLENNKKAFLDINVDDILSGHALSPKAVESLSKPKEEISIAISKVLEKYMPIPAENITYHPAWKVSVFEELNTTDNFFMQAKNIFVNKWGRFSIIEYLEYMSLAENPSDFMFRSDVNCIKYQSIHDSKLFLIKWFHFQFDNQWKMIIEEIFKWLTRQDFKKGGFEVVGPPNSGKSYVFGSLCDLFMMSGLVRPNAGYTFNFDNAFEKQVVMCDEFFLEKSDQNSIETLKDILSGNPSTIKVKHKDAQILKTAPWIFISNHVNFDFVSRETPWESRFYHHTVKEYTHWNDKTKQYRLNPYSWVVLFKELNYI